MLEGKFCDRYQRRDAEVGIVDCKTALGRVAPLVREDIHNPLRAGPR